MKDLPTPLVEYVRDASLTSNPKTILITGANSGIGLYAAKILRLVNPRHRLILVCRTIEKAEKARLDVNSLLAPHQTLTSTNIDVMACDQASLSCVHEFIIQLKRLLHQPERNQYSNFLSGLDAVCLNAAMMAPVDARPQYTEDDFEVTFQANHLAPFLISNSVLNLINPGGRIIFTTSSLHAMASFNGFQGLSDLHANTQRFEMIDGKPFHYKNAYALSKLANTTSCVTLNRKLRGRGKQIVVNCFTPGLIPSTGLFQHTAEASCSVSEISSTLEHGGGALAWMATSHEAGLEGGLFYQTQPKTTHEPPSYGSKRFCPSPIPDDARNVKNQEMLWELSAFFVGLEPSLKRALSDCDGAFLVTG